MPISHKGLQPTYELEIFQKGFNKVVGIDEVGRGAWAGPLVLAAFVFSPDDQVFENVNDSKVISKKKREDLITDLEANSSIIEIPVETIDEIGVGKATELGITELVNKHQSADTYFLMDGRFPGLNLANVDFIIDGDALVYSIAAASIFAKVFRDNLMMKLSEKLPDYGFDKHVGYGTKGHIEALTNFGVTAHHRKSYKPIQKFLQQNG